MNNQPKNHNPIQGRAPSQPEPVIPNTRLKFTAMLSFTQHSRARVTIEAASFEEAEEKANALHADDVKNWIFQYDDISVVDVQPAKDGKEAND